MKNRIRFVFILFILFFSKSIYAQYYFFAGSSVASGNYGVGYRHGALYMDLGLINLNLYSAAYSGFNSSGHGGCMNIGIELPAQNYDYQGTYISGFVILLPDSDNNEKGFSIGRSFWTNSGRFTFKTGTGLIFFKEKGVSPIVDLTITLNFI